MLLGDCLFTHFFSVPPSKQDVTSCYLATASLHIFTNSQLSDPSGHSSCMMRLTDRVAKYTPKWRVFEKLLLHGRFATRISAGSRNGSCLLFGRQWKCLHLLCSFLAVGNFTGNLGVGQFYGTSITHWCTEQNEDTARASHAEQIRPPGLHRS